MVVPIGAAAVGIGAMLFATGDSTIASAGRFLQGAGGVFALVGAIFIVSTHFPPAQAATLIGATQMFGMAGGSAGQFLVGPLIASGVAVERVLDGHGARRPGDRRRPVSAVAGRRLPRRGNRTGCATRRPRDGRRVPQSAVDPLRDDRRPPVHSRRPSSTWSGASGFFRRRTASTTARRSCGRHPCRSAGSSGAHCSAGSSDRMGRRKPVIVGGAAVLFGCLLWILYGPTACCRRTCSASSPASRRARRCCRTRSSRKPTRRSMAGTATGVVNFLNFTFSALLGPVFGVDSRRRQRRRDDDEPRALPDGVRAAALRRRSRDHLHAVLERDGTGRRAVRRSSPRRRRRHESTATGTGKYEALLERCRSLEPVPTAVAHPCEETALRAAPRGRREGADRADPRRPGREDRGGRRKAAGLDLGAARDRRRPAQPRARPRRRSSWCARARPSC